MGRGHVSLLTRVTVDHYRPVALQGYRHDSPPEKADRSAADDRLRWCRPPARHPGRTGLSWSGRRAGWWPSRAESRRRRTRLAAVRPNDKEAGRPGGRGGGGGREGGEREVRRRRRFSHYQATLLRGLTPLQPHPAGKSSLIFTKNNVPSDAGLRGEGEVGPPEYVLVDVLPPAIADDTVRAHGDQVVHLPQV